jgi:hypothetical protein
MRLQVQTGRLRDGHVRLVDSRAADGDAECSSAPPCARQVDGPAQAGRVSVWRRMRVSRRDTRVLFAST